MPLNMVYTHTHTHAHTYTHKMKILFHCCTEKNDLKKRREKCVEGIKSNCNELYKLTLLCPCCMKSKQDRKTYDIQNSCVEFKLELE